MAVFLMGALIGGVFGTAITHDVMKLPEDPIRPALPAIAACVETSRSYELTSVGPVFRLESGRDEMQYQRLDEIVILKCRFRKTTVEVPQ